MNLDELDAAFAKLRLKDATVYSWLETAEIVGASEVTALKSLVIQLAKEKKQYFDLAVQATNSGMPTELFVTPKYMEE